MKIKDAVKAPRPLHKGKVVITTITDQHKIVGFKLRHGDKIYRFMVSNGNIVAAFKRLEKKFETIKL